MIPIKNARIPTKGILSFMYKRTDTHFHRGIDLIAPLGTPVNAATGGIVIQTVEKYTPSYAGYGKVVIIKGNDDLYYLYAHLNKITTRLGVYVPTGKRIGTVGRTKYSSADPTGSLSTGAHLHFEVSDTPYPKHSEAERLDPTVILAKLDKRFTISNVFSLAFFSTAIGGVIYWWESRGKKQ